MERAVKMENEKKKEYLRQYLRHVHKINRIESDLEEIRFMKRYPSMNNDGMPHGSNSSDLSDYVALIDEKERELEKERYLRIKSYTEITNQIDLLENENERDVLHYRYIKGLSWWEVAEKMGYSERQIHRYHGNALAHFVVPEKDVSECQ